MTELEQKILDIIQDGFPIAERPYAVIAEQLVSNEQASCEKAPEPAEGIVTEQSVFDVVETLRSTGVIRRIGGVYDTKRLGLVSRLCAGRVPSKATGAVDDSALDAFAAAVMKVPAITHNYVRSHEYNVWFTVIAESDVELQSIIQKLCDETELSEVHSMPAKKMFKINTVMVRQARHPNRQVHRSSEISECGRTESLTELDKARIRLLSGNIPHSLTPFKDLGVNLDEVRGDLESKRMRRLGAVLRHQQAGFPCNAMVCFDIGVDGSDVTMETAEAGAILAANPHVSHCYERPPFEGFPYNVYAMFHAQTAQELSSFVDEAAVALGHPKYAILHSVKELKKTSYKYFA